MTTREPYRPQRIGNLRETVTLQENREVGSDGFGGTIYELVDVATVAARIEPLKGDEQVIAGGIAAVSDVLVHIRHRSDVDETWRVKDGTTSYNITAVRNLDERRRYLTLDCTRTT